MKNLLLTACTVLFAVSIIQAQKTGEIKSENQIQEELRVKVKDFVKADIYVDGIKFDFAFELLDQNKIESISVIKGEQAIKEYNASNGVVLVTTKKKIESDNSGTKIRNKDSEEDPVIIIDGKVSSKETLEKLSPNDVDKITVVKDEEALEKYNAPNGAVIITTKKGKK